MEYPGEFSVIEDHNLHQGLWRNLQRYWEQKDNYQQYTILKQMVKWKESTKR